MGGDRTAWIWKKLVPRLLNVMKDFRNVANTEFIRVMTGSHIQMRVWERGKRERDWPCGTGATADVMAGIYLGYLEHETEKGLCVAGRVC